MKVRSKQCSEEYDPWGTGRFPLIWDGKYLAWARLLPLKLPRMFKKVYEYSVVWSYSPKVILFCLSKETVHKSKRSLHWYSHKTRQGLADDESLILNYWDLKPMEKPRLLFHCYVRSYCFNQGGKYLLHLPPPARPENALDNVICVHGFRW